MTLRALSIFLIATTACTSMSTPPKASSLPTFAFSSLKGKPITIVVLDQRAGERDPRWGTRIEEDLRKALVAAGADLTADAPTRFEVRLLRARSDFEDRQWKGCVELTGRIAGSQNADAASEACVAKANLWGKATADNVLRLAYQDAIIKLLSALDSRL